MSPKQTRKSPRQHPVNTKHPRYQTPQYQRGQGEAVASTSTPSGSSTGYYWRDRYAEAVPIEKFRDPKNMRYTSEKEWERLVMSNFRYPEQNALLYIDPTTTATPFYDGMMADKAYYISAKEKYFDIIWMSPDK